MRQFYRYVLLGVLTFLLTACEKGQFSLLNNLVPEKIAAVYPNENQDDLNPVLDLDALIEMSRVEVNVDAGFTKAMAQALDQDAAVLASKNQAAASRANLRSTEASKDTKFNATVLGGIEDISDETAGVAAILTANRMLYDGGLLDAKISADAFALKAAEQIYLTVRAERGLKLAYSWIELERYQGLKDLIISRMAVLDPLLVQLESVAKAGLGDVSQIASAQRTVSMIIVAETDVLEKYEQASIAFINGFGRLPVDVKYDAEWVSNSIPTSSTKSLVENSPALLAKYWSYKSAQASVVATEAQGDFNIGFKAQLQRPFGGSGKGSDENIGFVIAKNLYQGDQLTSQVVRASEAVRVRAAEVFAMYQEGEQMILSSRQMIKSINKAIDLARSNADRSREEIDYLRKQLIIGGSTLQSVLAAEARLYDAESKVIGFIAERRKAEVTIMAMTGYLSQALSTN